MTIIQLLHHLNCLGRFDWTEFCSNVTANCLANHLNNTLNMHVENFVHFKIIKHDDNWLTINLMDKDVVVADHTLNLEKNTHTRQITEVMKLMLFDYLHLY